MSNSEPTLADKVYVLVVEDDELIHNLVGPALEEAGFTVVQSSSGDEAVEILEQDEPPPIRVLITDVDLGSELSGWDVAKHARQMHPDIPVVYMTGGGSDWSANGVPNSILLAKPFAPAQVVTAVSHLLNGTNPT